MDMEEDELQRFQIAVAESLQQFLSRPIPERSGLQEERINALLGALPAISERELEQYGHKDSICSICMQPFLAILAEEETASVMESPAFYSGELGVTRLGQPWQCGHLFCRRDITKWIKTGKLTCPMCRKSLVEPRSQPEQVQEQESSGVIGIFASGTTINLQDMYPDLADVRASNRHSRGNGDDGGRGDFSGMYS